MKKATRQFQVFAKPGGAICNMDCHYCYYLEKERLYPKAVSFRMPDDLLETYIVQHIEASPGPTVSFSWHGGEPTVIGLDYFRRIVALQKKHKPHGWRITNGMQTNGVLLDEEWCRFLATEKFGVGVSLDGPREMHDIYRVTKGRKPTHAQTMRGYRLLKRHGIACDILCVVHSENVKHARRVYGFFKEIGGQYLSFLPCVERPHDGASGVGPHTVPADAFGEFLCTIFDEWQRQDAGRMKVQIFEETANAVRGVQHSLCILRETCGEIPVVEHNGDFYSCDHYVDAEHRLGNIRDTPFVELLESTEQRAFGEAKLSTLPRYCQTCEVRPMCNGGCPKDRFIRTPDGEDGLNYLCAGFKRFFTHALPYLSKPESAPGDVRPLRQQTYGRNDPCPCGSGLKYKKCCLWK